MTEATFKEVLAQFLNDYWGAFHEALEAQSVTPRRLASSLFDRLQAEHRAFAASYADGPVEAIGGLDAHQHGFRVRGRLFSPMANERYFRLLCTYALCDGPPTGDGATLWHGFITDCTGRKSMEVALQDSEARYRSLFENSLDAILLALPDGGFVAWPYLGAQLWRSPDGRTWKRDKRPGSVFFGDGIASTEGDRGTVAGPARRAVAAGAAPRR